MKRLGAAAPLVVAAMLTGCGGGSHPASTRPTGADAKAIQAAQRGIVSVCTASSAATVGSAATLVDDVGTLIAAAKKYHDPGIAQASDAVLRGNGPACEPSYADQIDVALLPPTPSPTAEAQVGIPDFGPDMRSYYATHFANGESASQRNCVTSTGYVGNHVGTLTNLLYLLKNRNAAAQKLLAALQSECAAGTP